MNRGLFFFFFPPPPPFIFFLRTGVRREEKERLAGRGKAGGEVVRTKLRVAPSGVSRNERDKKKTNSL